MTYVIRHNTEADIAAFKEKHPSSDIKEWDLLEDEHAESMRLGSYDTEDQAKFARLYWETTDLINERLGGFADDLAVELGVSSCVIDHYLKECV